MEYDDYVRRGQYLVKEDALEEVQETFDERSERSKATDKSLRAPITTDLEQYKSTGGRGVDFPGVDTPTKHPSENVEDFPFPGGRKRPQEGEQKNVIVARDPAQQSQRDAISDDLGRMNEQGNSIRDALNLPF